MKAVRSSRTLTLILLLCFLTAGTASGQVATPAPAPTPADPLSPYTDLTAAARESMETVKWIALGFLGLATMAITLAGVFSIASSIGARRDAGEAAALAGQVRADVENLKSATRNLSDQIRSAAETSQTAARSAGTIARTADGLSAKVGGLTKDIDGLQKRVQELGLSIGVLDRENSRILATLMEIDQRRKVLLGEPGEREWWQTQAMLLEKEKSASPLVRREAIGALACAFTPHPDTLKLFQTLISTESDPAILPIVRLALEKWAPPSAAPGAGRPQAGM